MRYRKLGASGLEVSEIALGSYLTYGQHVDREGAKACVYAAADAGINLFDTADGYGDSETILGDALRELPRRAFVIATKCYLPQSKAANDRGLSRKHIVESVDRSLSRLRVSYLDLMQCHRFDAETPLDETVQALDDLVRQGKVLYWGVCRFDAEQTAAVAARARALGARAPVSNQHPYSLLNRDVETEVLPACQAAGLGLLAYYPLAQGVLTGKYGNSGAPPGESRASDLELRKSMWDYQPDKLARAARIADVAREVGVTPAQLALAWCLRQSAVSSVITGASQPAQIKENSRASEVVLDDETVRRIQDLR